MFFERLAGSPTRRLWRLLRMSGIYLLPLAFTACSPAPTSYDLVIENGRVIDPETGLDGLRHIGINEGSITAISETPLAGTSEIDATGLVVAPGFIDIHSHSPTPLGVKYQVLDGVTTQLDLEAGAWPVGAYGFMIKDRSPIHYGNSVSHLAARIKVIEGKDVPYLINPDGGLEFGAAFVQPATGDQIEQMRQHLAEGLDEGGIGIGLLLDYLSVAVSEAELKMVFELAGTRSAPVTVHVRRGLPGDAAGLDEIIALAEIHKVPVLICHITHSAMQAVPDWLAKIDAVGRKYSTSPMKMYNGRPLANG